MFKLLKITFSFCIIFIFFISCRKNTDIKLTVFSPNLHEFTKNATVQLIEQNGSDCKVIESKMTDIKGEANFKSEKLRRSNNYKYYFFLKNTWGKEFEYTCGNNECDNISKGGTYNVILNEYSVGNVRTLFLNLFNGYEIGDSVSIKVQKLIYPDQNSNYCYISQEVPIGLNVVATPIPSFYPNSIYSEYVSLSGVLLVTKYSRKMGIPKITTDTIKAYPNSNTTIVINYDLI